MNASLIMLVVVRYVLIQLVHFPAPVMKVTNLALMASHVIVSDVLACHFNN